MFTRTLVTAEVSVERIYKDKGTGEIKKDCFDEKLPNCKTRDKAEILIEKQYKGDIVSILDIKACGMSSQAKRKFIEDGKDISELSQGLNMESCNLKAERVKGGIVLRNKDFKIHAQKDKKIMI